MNNLVETGLGWERKELGSDVGFGKLFNDPKFQFPASSHPPSFLPSFLLFSYWLFIVNYFQNLHWVLIHTKKQKNRRTPGCLAAPGLLEEPGSGTLWSWHPPGLEFDYPKWELSFNQHLDGNFIFQYTTVLLCVRMQNTQLHPWLQFLVQLEIKVHMT